MTWDDVGARVGTLLAENGIVTLPSMTACEVVQAGTTATGKPIYRATVTLVYEFVNADEPACVELVPVTQSVHWSPKPAPRPDPTFVAQLIATAERAPQTRGLRRASLADAQTAYGASQIRRSGTGFRTRQTI